MASNRGACDEEFVEATNLQTDRIGDINRAVDNLVADLDREAPADDCVRRPTHARDGRLPSATAAALRSG